MGMVNSFSIPTKQGSVASKYNQNIQEQIMSSTWLYLQAVRSLIGLAMVKFCSIVHRDLEYHH